MRTTPAPGSLRSLLGSLTRTRRLTAAAIDDAVGSLSEADAVALLHDWRLWARPEQVWPGDDGLRNGAWLVWLVLAGRGWGKTRTGAEAVREVVAGGRVDRIALVGPTAADARDTMVEGESGLLSIFPPDESPDRLDALVWALTELLIRGGVVEALERVLEAVADDRGTWRWGTQGRRGVCWTNPASWNP